MIPNRSYVLAALFTLMGIELVFKSLWDALRQPHSTPAQQLLNTAYLLTCLLIAAFLTYNTVTPLLTARRMREESSGHIA